ncbi:MAG: DUF1302 domain-containing protein [Nevskiales bacterium]
MRAIAFLLLAWLIALPTQSWAIDFDWRGLSLALDNRVTLGAAWRLEERDDNLLAKLNVPGQQDLCTPDDCLNLGGDPEPIRRLANAKGGFGLTNADNGNMNYDQYDMVSAIARLDSQLSFSWGEMYGKVNAVAFYDAVNADFDQFHYNTRWQPPSTKRSDDVEELVGKTAELREAFVGGLFPIPFTDGRELVASVGSQRLRWGEANLHLFNTLDFINPLDAGLARVPGLDVSTINLPVGMLILGTDLNDVMALEFFYQYDWEPTRPDAAGSFLSTSDVGGSGEYAILGLGQFSEDPNKQFESNGAVSLISSATRTIIIEDEEFGYPEDGGQYGLKFSWYIDQLFNGTQLSFHYANFHSRLPYASTLAADASCAQDAAVPGNIAAALIACNGFNGSINPTGQGREPFPVDTLRLFLDYPEDIGLYGISFNSKLGSWAISGEYSYYQDMPLQILQSDLVFASLQNAAPPEDLPIGPLALADPLLSVLPAPLSEVVSNLSSALPSQANLIFPGARSVFPDLLTRYRGRVPAPGEYVPGYERLDMGQLVINGVRVFSSSNPIKADSIIFIVEAGLTHVIDMPKLDELAFQGAGDFSHPTPGSDGSGQPAGQPVNTLSINPRQQTEGFAEDFSWGLRSLVRATYSNVFDSGINLLPTLIWFEDIEGISPSPMQNYVEGRRLIVPSLIVEFNQALSGSLVYQYHDGELTNLLRDRDNISISLSYDF